MRNGSVSTPYRQQFKQSSTSATSAGKWRLAEIPCPRIALAKNITAQVAQELPPKASKSLSHVLRIALLISTGSSACSRHLDASWWTIHDESIVHARLGLQYSCERQEDLGQSDNSQENLLLAEIGKCCTPTCLIQKRSFAGKSQQIITLLQQE